MSIVTNGTSITFNDNTVQTTAYIDYAAKYAQLTTLQATISSTQTYTIPAGVTVIRIELQAGGGGGSSGTCCSCNPGEGGGGGGAVSACFPVTPGTSYTVTIGSGGNGATQCGADCTAAGSPGGASSFGSVANATGGGGGGVNAGATGGSGSSTAPFYAIRAGGSTTATSGCNPGTSGGTSWLGTVGVCSGACTFSATPTLGGGGAGGHGSSTCNGQAGAAGVCRIYY